MNETTQLSDLKRGREKRALTIRVIRKWAAHGDMSQSNPIYVGMILADAQANALYAEIPQNLMPKKEYLLDIGKVYTIRKFNVNNARPTFKPIERPLMIEFTEFTTIELAKNYPPTIPNYICDLTPFSKIVPAGKTVFKYTDVIGYITKFTALQSFTPKNKEKVTNLRKLFIKDQSDKEMTVTLWGNHAINFTVKDVYDEKAGNVVVCLLVGCIPRRDYQDYDKIYLSASSAFCCYFNPPIPEAAPFYSRFKDMPVYIDCPSTIDEPTSSAVVAKPLKLMTIADLNAVTDPFELDDGLYKSEVTVTSLVPNVSWWYLSCRRHKKKLIRQEDHSYRCPTCNGSETVPRYLLSFLAKDDTGEARFFAHDDEATVIVGRDCESVMSPLEQSNDFPCQLQNIIGKKYVFSLGVSTSTDRQYVVKAVLQRPTRQPQTNTNTSTPQIEMTPAKARIVATSRPTSGLVTHSPRSKQDILCIEPAPQTTPAPSLSVDDGSAAADEKSETEQKQPDARRKLFEAVTPDIEAVETDENVAVVDKPLASAAAASEDPLEPNNKKPKTATAKGGKKVKTDKSSSADT